MKTLELPTSPATVAGVQTPAGRPADRLSDHSRVGTSSFDGITWTYRNGFDLVLSRVAASAWADPRAQGWECVKQNLARSVWRARIGEQTYYLKYYMTGGWLDHLKAWVRGPACQAEWRSGLFAFGAGIDVVPPAGFADKLRAFGHPCALLVTEALEPTTPLNEFWATLQTDEDDQRRRADTAQLIETLAELIARAHQSGFEHTDMHAENILVQRVGPRRYRAVFVDLHSARLDTPISDRAVLRNLAQLNQWFRRHASIGDRLRFLRAYLRWRGEFEHTLPHGRAMHTSFESIIPALARAAERHAARLCAQRDRRALRNGRYFGKLRTGSGWRARVFLACKRPRADSHASRLQLSREWWRAQLSNPLRWFTADGAEDCKNSHSAQVRRAVLVVDRQTSLPVIIKRPLARDWWRRLRMLLPPSRSMRGWRIGNALLHRDQAAARPLAVLEKRIGPLVLDSVLLTEALPGACDLEAHLTRQHGALAPGDWFRHKRSLCEALVRHIRQFERRGFAHLDCKAGNILVAPHPRQKLLWIDMDGVRRVRRLTRRQRLRALSRLHVSLLSVPGLTRTDSGRFLKAYCYTYGGNIDAWRGLWRELEALIQRKRHKREARRTWKLKHYGRS